MRLFVRSSFLVAAAWAALATSSAAPVAVALDIRGTFDPGASGGTALNGPTQSSLVLGTATLGYDAGSSNAFLNPGDVQVVELGTLYAATADVAPTRVSGARLELAVTVDTGDGAPLVRTFVGDVSGEIGPFGETLALRWQAPLEVDFDVAACVPKRARLEIEPVTTVLSGDLAAPIGAAVRLEYLAPLAPGDVDGDGHVTLADAARALNAISGLGVSSCADVERGDMNADAVMDLTDATRIVRLAHGMG